MTSNSRRSFLRRAALTTGATTLFPGLIRDALAVPANNATGTLADIEHVVIFMQENRAFDHYFGCMAGVRGFSDPRAITLPSGQRVWHQPDGKGGTVLPFHFDAKNTSALSLGTSHHWKGSQSIWQGWDAWVSQKTARCMGYFDRGDIPFYYALADAFTICDAYHCSIFGATDPNRLMSLSGSHHGWIGDMGSLYNISSNGYYNADPANDNLSASVTASAPDWRTFAEVLEANQVSWKVYQEWDNYGDNYLAYFKNFRVNPDGSRLDTDSPLYQKGRPMATGSSQANARSSKGDFLVNDFQDDINNNRLPRVSWICAPTDYTEHSPSSPNAGENLTARLLTALVSNPQVWSKTVFMLTYDENDGFFDHMPADLAPLDSTMGRTTLADVGQFENYNGTPVGLGPRVPMLIISPWSKGGRVCSQLFDHTSKIRFLEQWLVHGLGKNRSEIECTLISPWRRAVCGDLTSALDLKNPNTDWPGSVPKSTRYQLVSGKPYPHPPANPTLPRQEVGSKIACALPYALAADARVLNRSQIALSFINQGSCGAAFRVYSSQHGVGPRYYTVEAGKRIEQEIWNWNTPDYALTVHGPNGFLRAAQGSFQLASQPRIETSDDALSGNLNLLIINTDSPCQFTLVDHAYARPAQSFSLAANQSLALVLPLEASFGWYDYGIRIDLDEKFMRHIAGHVETGRASRSDPALSPNPDVLYLSTQTWQFKRGSPLTFHYEAPAGGLDAQNWIGLYPAGAKPGNSDARQWLYAPAARGAVTFTNTFNLAPGNYAAWYLYKNGYAVLAGPLALMVL